MPYKFEYKSKKIPLELDRRIKLLPEQKQEIIEKYKTGRYSYNELAKMYNVSRSTIRFTIHPEYRENSKKSAVTYDREKRNKQMAKHRTYKKQLEKRGLLVDKEEK